MKGSGTDYETVSLEELHARWSMTDCVVSIPRLARIAGWAQLLQRVRGAFGHVLHESASDQARQGGTCPFDPPCAWDLFHNPQGMLRPGLEIPKPYVLRADAVGQDLHLTLRLFGTAGRWAGEVGPALIMALRRGIDGVVRDGERMALPVAGYWRRTAATPTLPMDRAEAFLLTETPIVQKASGGGRRSRLDPWPLLRGALWRIEGMALWHGLTLGPALPELNDALRAIANSTRIEAMLQTVPRGHAARDGFTGQIRLPTTDARMRYLVALACAAQIGADSTSGAGRVRLLA